MLTGKERAKLKAESHDFKPVVNIGKSSLTDEVLKSINEALESRELIKIKVLNNNFDDQDGIIEEILEKLDAEFVNHMGSIITIYKKSKENKFNI